MRHIKTRRRRRRTHKQHSRKTSQSDTASLRVDNFYLWANHKWLKEVPKTLPRRVEVYSSFRQF